MRTKQTRNKFKDENIRLRTRIHQCDKEFDKKDKIIQELLQQVQSDTGSPSKHFLEAPMVLSLKKQLRDMKEEQKSKEDEMKELKNGLKIGRMRELDAELKRNEDECANLKEMVIELIRSQSASISPNEVAMLDNKLRQQEAIIRNFKQENFELANSLHGKEEELGKYKESAVQLEKRVGKMESTSRDNAKNRKLIADNKREIERLKEQLAIYRVDNKEKEAATLKSRIDDLIKKQIEANDRIKQKDAQIQELEQKVTKLVSPSKEAQHSAEVRQLRSKIEACTFSLIRSLLNQ